MSNIDSDKVRSLINEFKKGNQHAFEEIIELLTTFKEYIIDKYKLKDRIEIEDLNQEADIAISNGVEKYDSKKNSNPIPFIERCIENRIINYINKERRYYKKRIENLRYSQENENVEDTKLSEVIVKSYNENKIFDSYYDHLYKLKKSGLDPKEMKIAKKYLLAVRNGENQTLDEIANNGVISFSKAQKIKKTVKNIIKPDKNKTTEKSIRKTEKKQINPAEPERTLYSTSKVFNEFLRDLFSTYHQFDKDYYGAEMPAVLKVTFDKEGNLICEIVTDYKEIEKRIPEFIQQIKFFKSFLPNTPENENWKSPKNVYHILCNYNLEELVKSYAPMVTKDQMKEMLKELGVYDNCRRYITRYNKLFKK